MTTPSDLRALAADIYRRYKDHYDGEVQGCCILIAHEICERTGAIPVAGEITMYGGTVRRTHWWAQWDNVILDPMGDDMMDPRDYPERVEVHRDIGIFYAVMPDYERWRIAL